MYIEKPKNIKDFTDLIVWQKGHALVVSIYTITKKFPSVEKFSLTDQIQRAAVSITSNIAEGFNRQGTKEKLQFYTISRGSLAEIHNQLLIAKDLHYISSEDFDILLIQIDNVSRLLNGLIKKTRELLN